MCEPGNEVVGAISGCKVLALRVLGYLHGDISSPLPGLFSSQAVVCFFILTENYLHESFCARDSVTSKQGPARLCCGVDVMGFEFCRRLPTSPFSTNWTLHH